MSPAHRRGFTLIEVMACVMILAMALTAACGLILYGLHLARSAHGRHIGMATALTVLHDASPIPTDPSLSPAGATTAGYLNGLWVVRSESAATPLDGAGGRLVAVDVDVDVFVAENGGCVASLHRRLIRKVKP